MQRVSPDINKIMRTFGVRTELRRPTKLRGILIIATTRDTGIEGQNYGLSRECESKC